MNRTAQGLVWIAVFVALVLSPLVVLLIAPTPRGRPFWVEFSAALAFAGLAVVGFQLLLTARIRRIVAPYGIDTVYFFHRQAALVGVALVLTHPLILFVTAPATLQLLNPFTAPWRAIAGTLSLLLLLVLVVSSLWRLGLRLAYERWREAHALLAVLAIALAFVHVVGVDYHLNAPWKREFWIVLGTLWIGALAYTRVVKPALVKARPYVVIAVIPEPSRTRTLVMAPDGHHGFRFRPGQFGWLSIWSSPFDFHEHPFSFSSSSEQPQRIACTIKALGDFTSRMGEVVPGTRVYIDGPYGQFSMDGFPAPRYLFVAGGIGITPLMSMLRTMADRGDMRPAALFYTNRDQDSIIFREELERLQERLRLTVVHYLKDPPEGWTGETGRFTPERLAEALPDDRTAVECFICGPSAMMDAVEAHLLALGVPGTRMHAERFDLV